MRNGPPREGQPPTAAAQEQVASVPLWYHTMEVHPGVVTPGWFDLRPIIHRIPWPELSGARCLDVATYDGHLAFEMERRGAAEVQATDIASHEDWDWLPRARRSGPQALAEAAGTKGHGFEVARALLGSGVKRHWCNVYDLDPETHGRFDVVTMGALLLHLRDPFLALERVRSVTSGVFLSIEAVHTVASLLQPGRPVLHLDGHEQRWMIPSVAGHRRMLEIAGFDVLRQETFCEPFGPSHKTRRDGVRIGPRRRVGRLLQRLRFGGVGVSTSALLCKPTDFDNERPPARSRPREGG